MAITLYSLGAAQEVTGSKHVLEVDGKSVLVDCGAFQGKRAEADRKNRNFDIAADKIETVVLTHAHYDHCGLLPVLIKKGYRKRIFATPATRDIANLIMMDSARIQARDAEYLRKQAVKKGEQFNWEPLFTENDVLQTTNQFVTFSYDSSMEVMPGVELTFFDAGHILGSAFALLTVKKPGKDDVRILYSGDLGRKNKPIIRDPDTEFPAPDYIVLESTYGNRRHADTDVALDELERIVRKAVSQKGKIIIPSFAIERTQELVYYFHMLVDQKRIPKIPIYVDSPMATNATSIFQVHPECYDEITNRMFLEHHKNPFGFNELSFITSVDESKALNDKPGPMVIISADGMCEFGRVVHHLANNISKPQNTVLIVGYMAEHTLGRRLQNREKEVKILGDWYNVRADIENIDSFSAHADYAETVEWLREIDTSRLKKIFMVHGETDAQAAMLGHLADAGYKNVQIVKYGESYQAD